ncbi:MAG: 4-hydroxy-tetrahydrodipicolinate reductase [Brumimicrobium sp.]|nr:4-hydroxy-tetrahydrodipicolinate reductase [Brumimicrobium sp.]MCO5268789.1 4-hydroxy-tetrahydrodipicolinate reductase [Brumimicrobium sp.]
MKVILVGYGKMGKEIETILLERGHEVVAKADIEHPLTEQMVLQADVAIEFTTPSSVLAHLELLSKANIPTVVGTTGWHQHLDKVKDLVQSNNSSLVYASNFSIGVNLFFQLNEQLAKLMSPHPEYQPKITEIHHTQKLDAPSGTAISIAQDLLHNHSAYTDWFCPQSEKKSSNQPAIEIEAIREEDVKGTHIVEYTSDIDAISIRHEAFSRKGFALGAVIAAEWIINKKGLFTMKDVLQLS